MALIEVNGVQDSDGEVFKTLPTGIYDAEIISCEVRKVKKEGAFKGANMLSFGFKVEDPDSGISSTVFDILMLPCAGHDAEGKRKALAKLKLLQIATGTEGMGDQIDTDMFLHTQCRVEVTEKDDPEYGKQNKIKNCLPM